MGRMEGDLGEMHFENIVKAAGFQVEKSPHGWYDYDVDGIRVEVKSCALFVKHSKRIKGQSHRIGRYDFTRERNRELQKRENIWICFLLDVFKFADSTQHITLGFCRAAEILNGSRYVPLLKLAGVKLLSVED
jgi:hypothetical protein